MESQQQHPPPKKPFLVQDFVLIGSSMHLLSDFLRRWDSFGDRSRSLHMWLLASYSIFAAVLLISFAMPFANGSSAAGALISLRQKSTVVRLLASATWWVMAPLSIVWTITGTWLTWHVMMHSPQLMPSGLHLCFLLIWQIVSYAWVADHSYAVLMAWRLERLHSHAESDLRALQDDDSVQRWGRLDGGSTSFLPTASAAGAAHLTATQISSLPGVRALGCDDVDDGQDCPICLMLFGEGDVVRQLCKCRHDFHRSCVDLWLLRAAECPLCKTRVEAEPLATDLDESRLSSLSEAFAVQ